MVGKAKNRSFSMVLPCLIICLLIERTTSSYSYGKDSSSWPQSPMYPSLPTIRAVTYHNVTTTSSRSPLWKNVDGSAKSGRRDSIDSFLADVKKLDGMLGRVPILTKTHSKRDSSYTKSWTDADWELHQIKSFRRYAKHMRSWCTSPTFISVLPTVLTTVAWTTCCILAIQFPYLRDLVRGAPFSHSISSFTSPISILLALKTNRSLNRLVEARSVWGKMIRVTTSLAGMSVNYISPIDPELGILTGRYLAAFGWCMKGKLRGEDDGLVLRTLMPSSELEWMESSCSGPGGVIDTPSIIIFRLRSIVAKITNDPRGCLSIAASQVIEQRLGELESSVGICKKIVASPIPPTFTRMTSRVLCLFLWFLPLALVSSGMQSPLSILVIVTFLSYIFVGIDEIGVEVEYPFPLLPLFSLAANMKAGVANQYRMMKELTL
mmetsp:Transcript_29956/g.64135  ORF Transcript_29956/g.64135 Transcript_29956/m.64135 type:complete len:435 (-) Transcript_29956:125-1429(-)